MAGKRKGRKQRGDPVADELSSIKRLLILQLVTSGVQANIVASALGVSKSAVSGLVPTRKVKKSAKKR